MTRYMLNTGVIDDTERTKESRLADALLRERDEEEKESVVKTLNW